MANFKPNRGDYAADGALYTVEAKSYEPNDFNLYNMAGNVSEWTESSYYAEAYEFVSTMNPHVADKKNQRKVVRGGSWYKGTDDVRCTVRYWDPPLNWGNNDLGFRIVLSSP